MDREDGSRWASPGKRARPRRPSVSRSRAFLFAGDFFGGLFGRVSVLQIDLGTVVGVLAVVGLGIVVLYLASRDYNRYRMTADMEPTAVAALEPGLAEVTGTVVAADETHRFSTRFDVTP